MIFVKSTSNSDLSISLQFSYVRKKIIVKNVKSVFDTNCPILPKFRVKGMQYVLVWMTLVTSFNLLPSLLKKKKKKKITSFVKPSDNLENTIIEKISNLYSRHPKNITNSN